MSDEEKKAAADLATYSLSIDAYITNTEKESKHRKTGIFSKVSGKCSWYKLIFHLLSKTIEKQLWKLIYQSLDVLSSFQLSFSYS